jgi:hypothetical protein
LIENGKPSLPMDGFLFVWPFFRQLTEYVPVGAASFRFLFLAAGELSGVERITPVVPHLFSKS